LGTGGAGKDEEKCGERSGVPEGARFYIQEIRQGKKREAAKYSEFQGEKVNRGDARGKGDAMKESRESSFL